MKIAVNKISSVFIFNLIFITCFVPQCALAYFPQVDILDISNEKLSYAGYTKSNVLVIGEGMSKKFFKEKYVLVSPENVIKDEANKTFKNSIFILEEVKKVLDKRLDFNDTLFEIKKLQALANYSLCEFEESCKKKHASSEFAQKFCSIPLDRNQDLAVRNVATSAMSRLLEVTDLVANSDFIRLKNKDGEILEGILMDLAEGVEVEILRHKKIKIEPHMQKALTSLQIFDSICGQCDRFYRNYNIVLSKEGNAATLCAFDNDWSFSLDTDMKKGRTWLPPIINDEGLINLPHIDKSLAKRILELDSKLIETTLKGLLDTEYIVATQNRLKQIQHAIKNSASNDERFLLDGGEWSEITINEEINGNY